MKPERVPVLEIGGTHVTAAWVRTGRWGVEPGSSTRLRLDAGGSTDEVLATIVETATAIGPAGGARWGVAIPGPFDYDRGVGDFRGVGKFAALHGVDLGRHLGRALGAPTGCFGFVNDAHAFGIGEWAAGAALGHPRAVAVTLGTGVGSAFLVDGVPQVAGPGVPPSGRLDLAQVRGRPLEEHVSRSAIRAAYGQHSDAAGAQPGPPDVHDIASSARAGDPAATAALAGSLTLLGGVLAPLAVDFGASAVVVGGSIVRSWDVVAGPLRAGMDAAAPGWSERFEIVAAQHLDDAALVGAAMHAVGQGACA